MVLNVWTEKYLKINAKENFYRNESFYWKKNIGPWDKWRLMYIRNIYLWGIDSDFSKKYMLVYFREICKVHVKSKKETHFVYGVFLILAIVLRKWGNRILLILFREI